MSRFGLRDRGRRHHPVGSVIRCELPPKGQRELHLVEGRMLFVLRVEGEERFFSSMHMVGGLPEGMLDRLGDEVKKDEMCVQELWRFPPWGLP